MSAFCEPLVWDPVGAVAHPQPARVTYRLCRCGQSRSMPFRDGKHLEVGLRAPGLGRWINGKCSYLSYRGPAGLTALCSATDL